MITIEEIIETNKRLIEENHELRKTLIGKIPKSYEDFVIEDEDGDTLEVEYESGVVTLVMEREAIEGGKQFHCTYIAKKDIPKLQEIIFYLGKEKL